MDFSGVTQDPASLDPKVVGLKSGIEIHQQLATRKLFCQCPSIIRDDEPDFTVVRQLRASAGESGETDLAALHETLKGKEFHYQGYYDSTCLVELDEEPPHPVDTEALRVALQAAKLLSMTILPRVQVMRKTVVDGSNTSGFQRTMLLALGGAMEVPEHGRVGIQSLMLEEDAAQILTRTPKYDVYNLSRLGIPLIEIGTDPDLVTPEMVRDAAAYIGMLLRSTRRVRRGIGTIRQDVNVSVRGGSRVEIKGAQDLKSLPLLVRNEMARQKALVLLAEKLDTIAFSAPRDITPECKGATGFLAKAIERGQKAIGVGLSGMKGLLGLELYPGYRVGTELAGYAKANGFGGLIHSDEDEKKYGLIFPRLAKELNLNEEDGFFLLVGEPGKAKQVIEQILKPRIQQLCKGVPSEVRKAEADATSTYLRPMPGAARMYPETDIPDVVVDERSIEVPKLLTEQIVAFSIKHKLSREMAKEAIEIPLFEELVAKLPKLEPQFIAEALITMPKEIRRREGRVVGEELLENELPRILKEHQEGRIPKDAVYELLVAAIHGKPIDFSKYASVSDDEIVAVVNEVIRADPDAPVNALMGEAMKRLRGRADGKKVMALLRKRKEK